MSYRAIGRLGLLLVLIGVLGNAGSSLARANSPAADRITLTLTLPSYHLEPGAQQETEVRLDSPAEGYTYSQPIGAPVLPHRQIKVALPPDADLDSIELHLLSAPIQALPGLHRLPLAKPMLPACASPGGGCPATFGTPAGLAPPNNDQAVRLLPYGQMRKWRFARLDYAPFLYEAASQRLSVVSSVTVEVRFQRLEKPVAPEMLLDTAMDDVAAESFINFDQAQPWYEDARQAVMRVGFKSQQVEVALPRIPGSVENGDTDYLILVHEDIYDGLTELPAFITFLNNHGHTTTGLIIDDLAGYSGNTQEDRIRSLLKVIYIPWGLKYVLMVGDPTPGGSEVPLKTLYPLRLIYQNNDNPTPSDAYYVDLTGNWDLNNNGWYGEFSFTGNGDGGSGGYDFGPELYVGRIPVYASNPGDLEAGNSIFRKMMRYESITIRDTWQDRALLPMTFFDNNLDAAVLGHLLRQNVLTPAGFTTQAIFMNHNDANDTCDQISQYSDPVAQGQREG